MAHNQTNLELRAYDQNILGLSSRALDPVFSGLGSLYSYPGSSLYSSVFVAAEGTCHDRVSPGISREDLVVVKIDEQ
jgi:hypothetical protein